MSDTDGVSANLTHRCVEIESALNVDVMDGGSGRRLMMSSVSYERTVDADDERPCRVHSVSMRLLSCVDRSNDYVDRGEAADAR